LNELVLLSTVGTFFLKLGTADGSLLWGGDALEHVWLTHLANGSLPHFNQRSRLGCRVQVFG
jgi:hypothetical protein